jgi:transcriptional regulator GlxA family with amidase domain
MHAVDARTVERRFAAAMGMTPKRFARIVRFRHAYRRVLARSPASATDIDGFYDQSHFLKEFRAFTGSAPTLRRNGAQPQGSSISDHLIDAE